MLVNSIVFQPPAKVEVWGLNEGSEVHRQEWVTGGCSEGVCIKGSSLGHSWASLHCFCHVVLKKNQQNHWSRSGPILHHPCIPREKMHKVTFNSEIRIETPKELLVIKCPSELARSPLASPNLPTRHLKHSLLLQPPLHQNISKSRLHGVDANTVLPQPSSALAKPIPNPKLPLLSSFFPSWSKFSWNWSNKHLLGTSPVTLCKAGGIQALNYRLDSATD